MDLKSFKLGQKSGTGGGGESWITSIPEMHRNIFRGKYLGSTVTAAQRTAISDGSFDDLYVGDYWTIGGVNWRIADIDYLYGSATNMDSPEPFLTHHLVIVPDSILYTEKYHYKTNGYVGYANSDIKATGLVQAETMINDAFGDVVLSYTRMIPDLYNSTHGLDANTSFEQTVGLMTSTMVYGSDIIVAFLKRWYYTITEPTQLALFRLSNKFIIAQPASSAVIGYWLIDEGEGYDGIGNVIVTNGGRPYLRLKTLTTVGVRPYFLIGAAA